MVHPLTGLVISRGLAAEPIVDPMLFHNLVRQLVKQPTHIQKDKSSVLDSLLARLLQQVETLIYK